MNEPRVIESVTNECQSLGRAHESSSARAEQLIACLEGEIAKRDETIARLEPQLNRAIQANYDLREELAACRVAVENCDLFRARIAEIEADRDSHQRCAIQAMAELAAIKAQEPVAIEFRQFLTDVVTGAGLLSHGKQSKGLASELSAKAYKYMLGAQVSGYQQKPIGYRCWFNKETKNIMVEWGKSLPSDMNPSATYQELYAAPVSEAKAQGVVQWPEADEIMQMAFEEGQPADDASGYCFELEEFDLFIERLMSEVARLNAAPAQQVSVPECYARLLKHAFGMTFGVDWNRGTAAETHRNKLIEAVFDCRHLLAAAPAAQAAPAADAGLVEALEIAVDYLNSNALSSIASGSTCHRKMRAALAAHRAKGVV